MMSPFSVFRHTGYDNKRFQYVIQLIEQYKHDNSGVMVFQDPQIQVLKLELKVLENRLNELTDTQADLERQINEFNSEYMQRLGSLIEATRENALSC